MEKGSAWALPEMLMWVRASAGMAQQVGQRGHAAHRIADEAGQALDAEPAHDLAAPRRRRPRPMFAA